MPDRSEKQALIVKRKLEVQVVDPEANKRNVHIIAAGHRCECDRCKQGLIINAHNEVVGQKPGRTS